MKQLNLEFDTTGLNLKPESGVIPGALELTRRIVWVVINTYAEQHGGLIKAERKQSYWLRQELEKAVANEIKVLDLPDDVCGFLRKAFREVRMPPDQLLEKVEANVDAIKME